DGHAHIVHHDLGAVRGHQQRHLAPDAAARAGDDGDLAVHALAIHCLSPANFSIQRKALTPVSSRPWIKARMPFMPSGTWNMRASRHMRSMPSSWLMPMAPCTCMASWMARSQAWVA